VSTTAGTDTLPAIDDVGTVVGLVTIRDVLEMLATYAPRTSARCREASAMTLFLILLILGLTIAAINRWGVDSRDTLFTLWPPNGCASDDTNAGDSTPRHGDLISLAYPRQAERSGAKQVSGSSTRDAA